MTKIEITKEKCQIIMNNNANAIIINDIYKNNQNIYSTFRIFCTIIILPVGVNVGSPGLTEGATDNAVLGLYDGLIWGAFDGTMVGRDESLNDVGISVDGDEL